MSFDQSQLQSALQRSGALQSGHFVLASGKHGTRFFRSIVALADHQIRQTVASELAHRYEGMSVGAVLGANLGGTLIAASVAEELSCRAVIAAQSAGAYRLIDGFSVEGERVLVVDDITTTGQTAHDLIKLVRASGGVVAGVGLLATKGLVDLTLGVETEVLVAIPNMDAVEPADCQACREGRPTT